MTEKTESSVLPGFDYDQYRNDTSVQAVKAVFKLLGEESDLLGFPQDAAPEQTGSVLDLVAHKVAQVLIEKKVPSCDMAFVSESAVAIIFQIFDRIARHKNELEKELLAYAMQSRNPGDNHLSSEYSTLLDLFKAIEENRIKHKDDPHGYFYTQQAPAETEEESKPVDASSA